MRSPLWAVALLSLLLAGCSSSKPKTYPVSGTVNWNNVPLAEGHILFEPAEGGQPEPGTIKDGTFSCRVPAGKFKVQIRASREQGEVNPAMGARPRVQFIPARYNSNTILEVEVAAEGENHFPFDLKSTP